MAGPGGTAETLGAHADALDRQRREHDETLAREVAVLSPGSALARYLELVADLVEMGLSDGERVNVAKGLRETAAGLRDARRER